MRKLTLLAGVGVGYVLGAKAGRERYDQIVAKARELAGQPAVQEVTTKAQQTASNVAGAAKAKANETVDKVNDKVTSGGSSSDAAPTPTIDLTAGTGAASAPLSGTSVPGTSTTGTTTTPGTTSSTSTTGAATGTTTGTTGTTGPMAGAAASDTV